MGQLIAFADPVALALGAARRDHRGDGTAPSERAAVLRIAGDLSGRAGPAASRFACRGPSGRPIRVEATVGRRGPSQPPHPVLAPGGDPLTEP